MQVEHRRNMAQHNGNSIFCRHGRFHKKRLYSLWLRAEDVDKKYTTLTRDEKEYNIGKEYSRLSKESATENVWKKCKSTTAERIGSQDNVKLKLSHYTKRRRLGGRGVAPTHSRPRH
jgi:hypothetical protein